MAGDKIDTTRTEQDFAAIWSSDGLTRSFAPTGTGVPEDLPFLFGPNQRLGPYLIVRPIGKGGMGQVYEAEETDSGRRVALKLLGRGLGDDEERERFLREGQLAASLSHPNCVYVFGTSEIQGFPVIAMELVPEGTLKDRVVPGSPMTAAVAVDAVLQVIAGLEAAASIGILHRDVKPSNCFVHREGRVLVGDFGLSVAAAGHGSGGTGTILGTPGFASPEQLRGDPLDVRSDIYAVGATLFYLLAGRAPFEDQSTTGLIEKVTGEPPPSLSELRPELPRRLALVIAKCLAKTAAERFADYASLRASLEPFGSARLAAAPIVRRAFAAWIDTFITGLPAMAVIPAFNLFPLSPSHRGDAAIVALANAAVMVLYFGVLEGLWGAAAGKALAGLRVVDSGQGAPGIRLGVVRALAFALPFQAIVYTVTWLMVLWRPDVPIRLMNLSCGAACIAVLFCTARPSNGYQGLHDRVTRTRVVKRRVFIEARERIAGARRDDSAPFEGGVHIGPYLVASDVVPHVPAPACVIGFDERLKRRVWIELLPSGTPPLSAVRRDLDRPTRLRWLGGRRGDAECWDAYEAVDGQLLDAVAAQPRRWSRVRHWLSDLSSELTAGLADGSLPPIDPANVWIGRDDRARVVEWIWPSDAERASRLDGGAADLVSAQRLLYSAAAGALLGVPAASARDLPPRTPLPLQARKALLSLKDATFTRPEELHETVTTILAVPAVLPRSRRAMQIAASAFLPVLLTIVTIGKILAAKGSGQEVAELLTLQTWSGLWTTALAIAAGTCVIPMMLGLVGALVTGSGFTFRPFGAALVNKRGERASRIRALWRAIVTWCPVVLVLLVADSNTKTAIGAATAFTVQFAIAAAILAAVAWAIARPSRGLADRLSGTWIVPR